MGIGLILEDGFRWITNLDGIYIGITLWLIWLGESQIDVRWCQMMIHDDPWTLLCCFMLKNYEETPGAWWKMIMQSIALWCDMFILMMS